MAVTRPIIQNNVYLGSLSEKQAGQILAIVNKEDIASLKHMICNYPDELIDEAFTRKVSVRKLIENATDKQRYIGELRPSQTVGVGFLYCSPRSILGDGVGTGKTVEISGLINLLAAKRELTRVLIAVENTAVKQVQRELVRFTGLNFERLEGTGTALERAIESIDWSCVDGLVVPHSKLTSEPLMRLLATHLENGKCSLFNTFILDESSIVKNEGTQVYGAVKEINRIMKRVHFLNATAFEISIKDVYNQLELLDENILPKWWRIENEFCVMQSRSYWKSISGRPMMKFARTIAGYKNQEVFKERVKLFYFGRNKTMMVNSEETNRYSVVEVYPSEGQRVALQQGYRSNEVLNCPDLIEDINIQTKDTPKVEVLKQLLDERKDKQIFVYCFNIRAQDCIKDLATGLGRKAEILNGTTASAERQRLIDLFNSGEIDILISNIQRSLNLHSGDTCIYYTFEGNPARMEQIRGRIDRNVDDKLKEFILLVYKGTDEYKWLVQVAKNRSRAASELTVESKTAVDCFIEAMLRDGQLEVTDRKGDKKNEKESNTDSTGNADRIISL